MILYNYHQGPRNWQFKKLKTEKTQLYYGLEIEIESPDRQRAIDLASNTFGDYLCCAERDSSLDDCAGLELIFNPCSYNFLQSQAKNFNEYFQRLIDLGASAHDNGRCGLHVNLSRRGLTILDIYKFSKIFSSLSVYTRKKITRRKKFTYCKFEPIEPRFFSKILLKKRGSAHYDAISIKNNEIAEIRFFRGTLNIESFFASIEIINQTVDFVQQNS